MKNKTSATTWKAFQSILKKSGRICKRLQVDEGVEFKGVFLKECKNVGINVFHVYSDLKSCVVERFNRTLMERVSKYMQHTKKNKFIHVLPDIVRNYNLTRHSSTKIAPASVNKSNEMEVWEALYGGKQLKAIRKPKFRIGETVLISTYKNNFEKGYFKKFQSERFIIDKIANSNPRMYYLKDESGEPVYGGFYEPELSRIR